MGVCGFVTCFLKTENEHSLGNFFSFNLLFIRIVTFVTLDLSNYILQKLQYIDTKSQTVTIIN